MLQKNVAVTYMVHARALSTRLIPALATSMSETGTLYHLLTLAAATNACIRARFKSTPWISTQNSSEGKAFDTVVRQPYGLPCPLPLDNRVIFNTLFTPSNSTSTLHQPRRSQSTLSVIFPLLEYC